MVTWKSPSFQWGFVRTKGKPETHNERNVFILNLYFPYRLIYIVGGCTHHTRHLRDLLSYNPVTTEWEKLSQMKVPRSQMGIAILNGHLYAIGGISKHAEVIKSVEKYNFEEDTWVEVASMKVARANPAVGAVDGKIYCIGGDQTVEQNFFRAQVLANVYNPLQNVYSS